jgi:SAM-dependent methyltransferase
MTTFDSSPWPPSPWPEDSYGRVKRLEFVARAWDPAISTVLDVGCGTGSQLTVPLARMFPEAQFLGIDSDTASLAQGRADAPPANLAFHHSDELDPARRFDLVIASEVLEHVDDPAGFLVWLGQRLTPGGRIVLTVPNGFGPFEWAQLIESLATLSGLWPAIRRIKRLLVGGGAETESDTLAVSPHVNFFSRRQLRRLFDEAGLTVATQANRTFLCGFLLDQMVAALRTAPCNARIADRLPAWAASDWMMILKPTHPPKPSSWRRSFWGSLRKSINYRRWGITP